MAAENVHNQEAGAPEDKVSFRLSRQAAPVVKERPMLAVEANLTLTDHCYCGFRLIPLLTLAQVSVGSFTFTISAGANARITEQIGDMYVVLSI